MELVCEVYGDSLEPVWTHKNTVLHNSAKHTIVVTGVEVTSKKVESRLSVTHVTEEDLGAYTCSVAGNSTTVTVYSIFEGTRIMYMYKVTQTTV